MVVTHEEEAAKTQLVSIKEDLVVRALDHNKKVVRKGERPRSVLRRVQEVLIMSKRSGFYLASHEGHDPESLCPLHCW